MNISINGTIMSDEWAGAMRYYGLNDNTCPGDVRRAVESGEDVNVYINSDGGELVAGIEMYSILVEYAGNTTAYIQSRAASAATVAMMGCRRIVAEAPSLICIHNPTVYADGTAAKLRHAADDLDNVKGAIIAAYRRHATVSDDELSKLMDRDVWITADEAKNVGIVDEIATRGAASGTIVNGIGVWHFPTEAMLYEYRSAKKNTAAAARARIDKYRW